MRDQSVSSDSMGNQGAAYALSEVYGPVIAAEMVFAAEVYFAWKDTQPWSFSDGIGSLKDNGIGIGQWIADNPGYLANPLLYAAYLLSKDIKGASSCSP